MIFLTKELKQSPSPDSSGIIDIALPELLPQVRFLSIDNYYMEADKDCGCIKEQQWPPGYKGDSCSNAYSHRLCTQRGT